jgi:hypothetical protein
MALHRWINAGPAQCPARNSRGSRRACCRRNEIAGHPTLTGQMGLTARPTQADLETIDFDGVLRRAADRLKSVIDDSAASHELRRRAEEALVELYLRVVNYAREEAA